ncbi:site-specific integrase [Acidocella sp.]|uniref:tyrosine-type recombinase/integrase n=1 Tax=Acidocella sp. TaxID=50710 RepID=UPI00260C5AEA|nr:site-specific integrase [Acidocella sp.]MDD2794396.1 site-specific integrase [Acidocella sp.]
MPLNLRKRGEIWHARGTVRVGTDSIHIAEFSTGARSRTAAEAIAGEREAQIRREGLEGDRGRQARLTISDCFAAYLTRPGGIKSYDKSRIDDFNEHLGPRKLAEASAAWAEWVATRGAKMAPATVARWRAIFMAALRTGTEALDAPLPKIPAVTGKTEQTLRTLTDQERTALLAAYNPAAAPVFLTLAYQGLRTQEALRLDWRHVFWVNAGSLYIPRSKSGKPRSVPMHAKVRARLYQIWEAAGKPESGPVFLSSRREAAQTPEQATRAGSQQRPRLPYADTKGKGGNPLKRAHQTACKAAGVQNFRIHDWRHDCAARMVMAGVDMLTIMKLFGWSDLRMVQIYASITSDHMAEAVQKIA